MSAPESSDRAMAKRPIYPGMITGDPETTPGPLTMTVQEFAQHSARLLAHDGVIRVNTEFYGRMMVHVMVEATGAALLAGLYDPKMKLMSEVTGPFEPLDPSGRPLPRHDRSREHG